jgi:NitT/TauT family transport system substrate-binding protein
MRRTFLAVIVVGVVFFSAHDPGTADEKISIVVSGADKMIYLPALLAESQGYFKDEGLNVELFDGESGIDSEDRMLTGTVHGVIGFYDHCITLQAKGKFVKSVVQLGQTPGEVELVSSKIHGIGSLADLKGKSLGVTGLGSSTKQITQYLMSKAGVRPGEYQIVPAGAGNPFGAALRQGQIEAGMTTDPTATALVESAEAKVLVDLRSIAGASAAFGGPYPGAALYIPESWVRKNHESVQKLVNALVRALKFIHAHSAEEIIEQMPDEYLAGRKMLYIRALTGGKSIFTQDGLMPENGPENVLHVLSQVSKVVKDKNIDLSKTFTNEFAHRAQAN